MRTISLLSGWGLLLFLMLAAGCQRYPGVTSKDGLVLIKALYTACSSQSPQRLAKVEAAAAKALAEGRISAQEHEKLAEIIAKARGGNWDAAADASWAFAQAQVR